MFSSWQKKVLCVETALEESVAVLGEDGKDC
jgi:hypothetical protein